MSEELPRLSRLDIFRLGAAAVVLATWIVVVVYASLHDQMLDFGVHAVCLVASGYLFASPVGKALRRVTDAASSAASKAGNGDARP